MKRYKKLFLIFMVLMISPVFTLGTEFLRAEAASTNTLGGDISYKHRGVAPHLYDGSLSGDRWLLASYKGARTNWHNWMATGYDSSTMKIGAVGLSSPNFSPPSGWEIQGILKYPVYTPRTYAISIRDCGGSAGSGSCHPHTFEPGRAENKWAINLIKYDSWTFDKNADTWEGKTGPFYIFNAAQRTYAYDIRIAKKGGPPVVEPPVTSPTPPTDGGGGGENPDIPPDPEIPLPPPNLPPRVTIDGPSVVMAGEDFCVNATGEDDDGEVVGYRFSNGPKDARQYDDIYCMIYPNTGDYSVSVVAIDDDGATSPPATHKITVIAPQPSADFYIRGTEKENRKVELVPVEPYEYRIGVIDMFPMVEEKWSISALDPANEQYIKTHANLNENMSWDKILEVLMKVRGDYKVTRYVKNNKGLEDTVVKIVKIKPDLLPVANFDVITKTFREDVKEKPQNSSATIKITDTSSSNDDYVAQRIWSYFYDSNNNGDFSDEQEVIVSTENEQNVNIKNLEKVGKYLIQLKVIEEFAQETIDDFVTPEDRRRHEVTIAQHELSIPPKPLSERIVNIDNLAPNATYDVKRKGDPEQPPKDEYTVDVQIALDETPYSQAAVQSGMATLRERLNAKNIRANITVDPLRAPERKVVDLAANSYQTYWVLDSGDVYVAGKDLNGYYPGGVGTSLDSGIPIPMVRSWGESKVIQVDTDPSHAVFLTDKGEVYASGTPWYSGADSSVIMNKKSAAKVDHIWSGKTIGIATGYDASYYIQDIGTLLAAGYNGQGATSKPYPVHRPPQNWGTNKIVQVSGGVAFSLALDETGVVYATGQNNVGQLGIGNTSDQANFTKIRTPWGNTKVVQVSAGQYFSLFLLENGEVWASGRNFDSELGTGNNTNSSVPVKVFKSWGEQKITKIHAGYQHSLALTESGEVWAWGYNRSGALGDGTLITRNKPVKVINTWGTNKNVVKFAGYYYDSQILLDNGETYAWGSNGQRNFGNNQQVYEVTIPVKSGIATWNLNREVSAWSKSDADLKFGALFSRGAIDQASTISNRMLEFDMDFLGIGIDGNKAQMNSIINTNMNKGAYFQDDVNSSNAANLERIANELADYIIAKVEQKKNAKEIYLTLDEEAEFIQKFRDEENDPKISEKWKFAHTPTVFEFDMGQDPRHMKEMAVPLEKVGKVGLYKPIYSAKDDPVFWGDNRFDTYRKWSSEYDEWDVYFHRKPIPDFSFKIETNRSYTITNEGYDLDKNSINIGYGPGIRSQKWEWREQNTTTWQEGLPPNPMSNIVYEVKNTVMDFQNREESIIKLMDGSGVNKPPIPLFEVVEQGWTDTKVIPNDMSYDPNGDDITEWRWWIKKLEEGDTNPTADTNFELVPLEAGKENAPEILMEEKGDYIIRLQVKDEHGLWSTDPQKYAYQQLQILSTNEEPTAGFTVENTYVGSPLYIVSTAIDPDNDPLNYTYTIVSPNGSSYVTSTGASAIDKEGFPIEVDGFGNVRVQTYDIDDVGTWTITQTVTDPDGASDSYGPVTAEVYPLILTGNVYHTEEWTRIHLTEGNAPDEFYSGEKFLLAADVSDYPVKSNNVSISGVLENGESFSADVSLSKESSTRYIGDYFEERFAEPGTMIQEGSTVTFDFSVVYENDYEPENYVVSVRIIGNVYDYLNQKYHRNY